MQASVLRLSKVSKKVLCIVIAVAFCDSYNHTNYAQTTVKTTSHLDQYQDLSWHPLLMVDTKYWIRNTEFSERENWRNLLSPCSLLERVRIHEQSVISLGNSLDAIQGTSGAIKSSIRELTLAENGILLLEEDIPPNPIDIAFIAYLNASHNCLYSNELNSQHQSIDEENSLLFEFQPDSDEMSWFNPENWVSEMLEDTHKWLPEAHQIPCSDDIVVFGSRAASNYWYIMESERSKLLSFKVNFKASSALSKEFVDSNVSVNSLRISQLKIGEQSFNQQEFEQLSSSELYKDILFDFGGGVLKSEQNFNYSVQSLLSIDESSIQQISGNRYCSDEAGCLCGNENAKVMKVICSFHYPLEDKDLPCYDPVSSVGHCNRICASVITIVMDPYKFSERFIADIVIKAFNSTEVPEDYYYGNVFVSGRRISEVRYEITLRLGHGSEHHYISTLGREQELAQVLQAKLNNEAAKSFYGIKSVITKSSVRWRKNNTYLVFWISYCISAIPAILVFIYHECNERMSEKSNTFRWHIDGTSAWITNIVRKIVPNYRSPNPDESDSFVPYTEPNVPVETDESFLSEIPLIRLRPAKI